LDTSLNTDYRKTLTPTLSLKKGEGSLFYKFPLLSEERNKVRSLLKDIRISE
jgi:hypothetical protein